MKQLYSSKDTSINVVNKVYKQFSFPANSIILDYGGGKYNTNMEYMLKLNNSEVLVYDKYNRTESHNSRILIWAKNCGVDYVVCSNVLNVIKEDEIIDGILKYIATEFPRSIFLLAVYEGKRDGIGTVTTKGYQRNERLSCYIPMVERYFDVESIKNGIVVCHSKIKEKLAM